MTRVCRFDVNQIGFWLMASVGAVQHHVRSWGYAGSDRLDGVCRPASEFAAVIGPVQ